MHDSNRVVGREGLGRIVSQVWIYALTFDWQEGRRVISMYLNTAVAKYHTRLDASDL